MSTAPRRSKRLEAIKDELAVSTEKPQPLKSEPVKKAASKGKVVKKENSKANGKTKAGKKDTKSATTESKGKSRSVKKEPIVIEDDEKAKEEEDEEAKTELEEGDILPKNLELETQDSKKINLLKYAKDAHMLVIFAYPKASTPGCTRQAQGFRDEYSKLNGDLKASVLGLSADNAAAQTKFKEKQNLPYDLLCDPSKKLITLLGCKKTPSGTIRSHFIFVDGVLKVKKVKISPEASFKGALEQVTELSK